MPKKAKELTAIEVKRLVAPGFFAVGRCRKIIVALPSPNTVSRDTVTICDLVDGEKEVIGVYCDVHIRPAV